MTVTTVPLSGLTRALRAEVDFVRRWAKQTRDDLGVDVLRDEQRAKRFPDDESIVGRINAVPTRTDPEATFRRATLLDTVDFTTSSSADNLAEVHRVLMQLLLSAAPTRSGTYKRSFETWLNGERNSIIRPEDSGGRSIFAVFNRAIYASPLEAAKGGSIFAAAAINLAARFPRYKVSFQYRLPTALTQDGPRISPRTSQKQQYAVPVIFVGTPISNLTDRIAKPGRNAARRARKAARQARRSPTNTLTRG